ncbi:MAG: succinyldiaminopimelate transaminase [Deltaproteobacteria bacterium]|nr:succinyldiaminopimelate transaminase [Deltaproteobacteria bacterium]
MVDLNPVVSQLTTYPAEALYQTRDAAIEAGVDVFDFSVGDPLEPTDPAIRQAFVDALPTISQYPTVRGESTFRRACAAWIKRRFAVSLDPDTQILPCSGAKEAIFHLPLVFLNPSRRPRVLYGIPGYPVYERGTLFAGGTPWPVELRPDAGYLLEPWKLDRQAIAQTAIIWTNYPHNPTGVVAERDYLDRLQQFAADHELLLCGDECYVDLYLDDPPPPSLLQGQLTNVLTFHSLSKRSGMTGYRSGFIAGDAQLISVLAKARANFGTASTDVVQRAAVAAWSDDAHVDLRRRTFREKRDVLLEFFAQHRIEHLPCRATLYIWVKTPNEQDAMAYAQRLAEVGIIVSPAPLHGVDQPYVRLALVPTVEDCRRAVEVWRKAL